MSISGKLLSFFWKTTENKDAKRIARQSAPEGITVVEDISYAEDNRRSHLFDIYYPDNYIGKLPVIIDIHGGGWMYGYKEINKYYNMYLASRGFCVFSINYTLAPTANYKQQISECFAAFRKIGEVAENYSCDMNNVFLTGDSAGGHLAALCCEIFSNQKLQAAFDVALPSFLIRAAGFTCGAFSMPNMLAGIKIPLAREYARYVLGDELDNKELNRLCNATELLPVCQMPPLYLSSSKQDFIAFETKKFCKKLDELNYTYKLRFWDKGKNHALEHVFNIVEPEYPESIVTNNEMTDFFKSYMI